MPFTCPFPVNTSLGVDPMTMITGAPILSRTLAGLGVHRVFSVRAPGLEPWHEALENQAFIRLVLARDETAAALMADGYIRASGLHAAVFTGAHGRNLAQVAGVTNAWADRSPLLSLALAEDAPPDVNQGWDRFRFDSLAVYAPVTVHRKRVAGASALAGDLAEALDRSTAGRPGPVHLEIPAGCVLETLDEAEAGTPLEPAPEREVSVARIAADKDSVRRAGELLRSAKRPLVLSGGGVRTSGASEAVQGFLERFRLPGATTMGGIGTLPADHEFCLGGPSYAAGEVFHCAIREADVILALGAAFSGLEGFGLPPLWSADAKVIHVDVDPSMIGLNPRPEVGVVADAKTALAQIRAELESGGFQGRESWREWTAFLSGLKKEREKRLRGVALGPWPGLHQARLAMAVAERLRQEDHLLVLDGGNTPLFGAMYAPSLSPRQAFFPFGMAALGGGLPYAVGVALARPEKTVILVTGDGSALYAISELATIARLGLKVKILVNNDSAWNMIRCLQENLFEGRCVGTDLPDTDFARVAKGFGIPAERVRDPGSLDKALDKALASDGPALVDCVTDLKNLPDSLLSFGMVEFQGVFSSLSPFGLLKSLAKSRQGLSRTLHMAAYIQKALLGINPGARRAARKGGARR